MPELYEFLIIADFFTIYINERIFKRYYLTFSYLFQNNCLSSESRTTIQNAHVEQNKAFFPPLYHT